jgi:biopolymer transport protein TolR
MTFEFSDLNWLAVIVATVSSILRNRPETPVMVRGDRNTDYGNIMHAMSLLQQAGAPSIGLVNEPPQSAARTRGGGGG